MSFAGSEEVSVGPFGSNNGGEYFDDGVNSAVKQFVIHYYEVEGLFNLQFEYDNNGISVWSDQLGRLITLDAACDKLLRTYVKQKNGGVEPIATPEIQELMTLRKKREVKLNYPDEFLTSVSGFITKRVFGPSYITSLTFTTNMKVYGPFGSTMDEDKTRYFSIQVPGCKIVGFHGRSSKYVGLCALGAYLMPLNQQPGNKQSSTSKYVMPYPAKPLFEAGYLPQTTKTSRDDNPNKQSSSYIALSKFESAKIRETTTELSLLATFSNIKIIMWKSNKSQVMHLKSKIDERKIAQLSGCLKIGNNSICT